jgi:hypothetical protein
MTVPLTEEEAEAVLYGYGVPESRLHAVGLYDALHEPAVRPYVGAWKTCGIRDGEVMLGAPRTRQAYVVEWCVQNPSPLHAAVLVVAARRLLERL